MLNLTCLLQNNVVTLYCSMEVTMKQNVISYMKQQMNDIPLEPSPRTERMSCTSLAGTEPIVMDILAFPACTFPGAATTHFLLLHLDFCMKFHHFFVS